MPIRYNSEVEGDYLHVVIEGSLCTANEMVYYINRIHEDLVQAGLCRVLSDETNCHVHMNLDELRNALGAIQEPEELKTPGRKSAVISSNVNHILSQHILGAVDCIRVFTELESAKKWLAEG
jgi:hypothetical protein